MKDPPLQRLSAVKEVLLPTTGAAGYARNLLAEACTQWPIPHLLGPASIITSEFVANAVVHASTLIDLHLIHRGRHLLILVSDGNPVVPARPRRTPSTTGIYPELPRGLTLVDATADQWGCRRITGGKTMWAALRTADDRRCRDVAT
jgi:anti-sigma regulatory factor (Ser/Thr protein kinase)